MLPMQPVPEFAGSMVARAATKIPYRLGVERIAAVLLLFVLATGLGVTNLTHDWVGSLPYHDHLILTAQSSDLTHHAHPGDPLDRAQRSLRPVEVAAATGQPHADAIVSLRPMTAQAEFSGATSYGWVRGFCVPLPHDAGVLTAHSIPLMMVGLRFAPPSPPPRPR